jgi:predicted secreted Zn-dependent protease
MPLLRPAILALLAAPALVAAQDAGPQVFDGIPNLTIEYYSVTGRSAGDIRKAIDAARPTDPNDGLSFDSLTRWRIEWRVRGDRAGHCDLANADLTFSANIKLPRLADETVVPKRVLARWQAYRAAVETHEAGHARYPYEHLGDVAAALRAATCATFNEAGQRAVAEIAKHDAVYDRETRHGATQGATFP